MSKQSKSKAAPSKAINDANTNAVVKFPTAKLKAVMTLIGTTAAGIDASQAEKQNAALDACKLAVQFRADNASVILDTVITGWRDEWRVLAMQLAVSENRFAELREATKDKAATAVMTGYGRNVVSIAKGCIEFEIESDDMPDSYREIRTTVEAKRAERDRLAHPEKAAMQDAIDSLDESWDALRKLVVGSSDIALVQELDAFIVNMTAETTAQNEAQAKLDAKATEDKNAVAAEIAALEEATKPDDKAKAA